MSYDIKLCEPTGDEPIRIAEKHFITGGTYDLSGTDGLWLNITYNYSPQFKKVFGEKGIRTLYGMTGKESIPVLLKAIKELKDDKDPKGYWEATEGNAKKALLGLLQFAKWAPHGVWKGD